MRGKRGLTVLLGWALAIACRPTQPATPRAVVQRDGQQAERALKRAEQAYLDGRYGDAILNARAVLMIKATPLEQRHAMRLVALASCINHDSVSLNDAWPWLGPFERSAVLETCAHELAERRRHAAD